MLIIFRKILVISMLFFSFTFVSYGISEPDVSASSAVLIDGDTNEILLEKNAFEKRSMASTTKIMTSLIAVESGKLDSEVTVKEKIYIEGTALGLEKGDKLTLRMLCYGMLLESGNDAAVQTARFLSGSEEKFSILMNSKAKEIGMKNTSFVTASGLDDPEHYTTAYDMALLGAYAVKNEVFREICSTKSYKAEFLNNDKVQYFSNHNRLLASCDGVFGIKTGFTKKSGRCLVSACERDGKVLVAVTLNAPDDWNDHKKLYDYGYSLYEYTDLSDADVDFVSVSGSAKKHIAVKYSKNESILTLIGSEIEYKTYLRKFYYAPVKENDILGKIVVLQNGFPICERLILSAEDAFSLEETKTIKPSLKERILAYINKIFSKEGKTT